MMVGSLTTAIYMCRECGYLYDESLGDPEQGVEPGTDINDLPENWKCPDCGSDVTYLERII